MKSLVSKLASITVPLWARVGAIAVLALASYGLGRLQEARRAADAPVKEVVRIVQGQEKVVTKTQIEYRDRVQKIYVRGETLEKSIPIYIHPVDTERYAVNRGFVRVLDAAWSGTAPGPAADTDREPSGVPIDDIAANEVDNATSCHVWREQALGWRKFYADQQVTFNGKAGDWYQPERKVR